MRLFLCHAFVPDVAYTFQAKTAFVWKLIVQTVFIFYDILVIAMY
jgi:hypothetical protein